MEALAAHPWPIVAMINGHCLGGGLELAITCDMRICAAGAKLGMPPAKLGLIYGHTGLRKFLDTIGLARTKELFLTGRNVVAARAEQIGLVHEVFPDEDLEGAGVELAAAIAANAPLSMRGNKQAIEVLNANPALTASARRPTWLRFASPAPARTTSARGSRHLPRSGGPRWKWKVSAADQKALAATGPEMAALIERVGEIDLETRLRRRSEERATRRLRSAAAGNRRPTALDQSGADDLRSGRRPVRGEHPLAGGAARGERRGPAGRGPLRAQGRVHPRPRRARDLRRARARPPRRTRR